MLGAFGELIKDGGRPIPVSGLRQTCLDGPGHSPAEEIVAAGVEVDVVGILHFGKVGGDRGEEIVHGDAVFLHQLGSGLVSVHD